METVVDFPNRDSIETEACAWIAQLDGDRKPSDEDMAALQEWANRSPLHHQELMRLSSLWGDLNILTELAIPAQQKASERKDSGNLTLGSRVGAWFANLLAPVISGKPQAVFTSLVLVGLLSMGLWTIQQSAEPVHLVYSTALGEQQSATLPDGSVIKLNTNSQVAIDYDKKRRKVRLLRGEAHFDVAHNPSRPFEVYAGTGRVRAIGTAFSVYLKDHKVEVTVTEGRVELASIATPAPSDKSAADNSAEEPNKPSPAIPEPTTLGQLVAGETTLFNDHIEPVKTLNEIDVMRKLSWREGMLIFSGESLEQVVAEISRYTSLSIVIADPQIRDVRIGGYFRVGETGAMFEALESSFGVQVSRISDQEVQLTSARP